MITLGVVEHISHEREFKTLCDALLRFELGPLVQTFATKGADRGIDAEFYGKLANVRGRWVFQYKYLSSNEAASKQRRRLTTLYCPRPGEPGEFDRPGVRGADGYVLLTNVPASVGFVDALKLRWNASRKKRPFGVWDPSTLNAMLKGREHLARSWTGAREERSRAKIIAPLWHWIEHARDRLTDTTSHPLWPLVLVNVPVHVHQARFAQSYQDEYVIGLACDDTGLRDARSDPQFAFARDVAYPRALAPLEHLAAPAKRLLTLLRREIAKARKELIARAPELAPLEGTQRLATGLAFALLEVRWGYPNSYHGIREGNFLLGGKAHFACPPAVPSLMDAMVAEYEHRRIPDDVARARQNLAAAAHEVWTSLWSPHEIGLDAD